MERLRLQMGKKDDVRLDALKCNRKVIVWQALNTVAKCA
jgi:hypothetical protein